jgi:DNA polymerase-3 subunit gamma/tau
VSYQVFARKYRPRTFDHVLGQDHVVRTLRNAIAQSRLAHAYLLVGPRGTGKTSLARIFAKALNCPGGPKVDFDPNDELCIEIEKGIALDVREIDGASNNGVDQVRALREEVQFAPSRSRFKIYYIDEVHMLSTAAFNALLKTLEEPPEHVKFIFATTEAHKVLPTIISRCQRFDLRRIPAGVIAKHLLHIAKNENVKLEEKAAYAIAKGADGGMRDAQSMLDQLVAFCGESIGEQDVMDIFGFTQGETVATLARRILDRDTVGALQELHVQADGGKDLSRLLADLIQHYRTVLVHQVDAAAAEEDLSPEVAAMTRDQAAMIEAERLLRVMDGLAEVDSRMRWAGNKLLHLELGVIQAIQTLGEVTLSEVISAIGEGDGGAIASRRAAAPVAQTPVASAPRTAPPASVSAPAASPAPKIESPVASPPKPAPTTLREEPAEARPAPASSPTPALHHTTPPAASAAPVAAGDLWTQFLDRVHSERPLLSGWLDFGGLLSVDDKVVRIGLPTTEAPAKENLLRPVTKKFLEGMLTEMLGRNLALDIVLDASLQPPPATEIPLMGFDDSLPPPSSPKAEPKAPEPKPEAREPVEKSAPNPEFYNDPLIQAALSKFKATLVN